MHRQDIRSPANGSSAPRANSKVTSDQTVDHHRARHAWMQAVLTHPELQAKGRRNMQRVVLHLALDVRHAPRSPHYGQCWPTVGALAAHCQLGKRMVQEILRRLVALGILTLTDRRPLSNLYTLDVGVDPWTYCCPPTGQE